VSLVVLAAGSFMTIMNISIVNVAILDIQNEFVLTTDDAQWVVTAYNLTLGARADLTPAQISAQLRSDDLSEGLA